MTYAQTHILLSEAWASRVTPDASGGISNFLPANGAECGRASLLTFEGRFLGVDTGTDPAPTSFEWALIPQIGIAHTTSYQRSRPGWRDVTPADLDIKTIGAVVATEGTPRIVVATESTGTRIFQIRVPVEGLGRFRFRSVLTYTGSKPSIRTGLVMVEKGE